LVTDIIIYAIKFVNSDYAENLLKEYFFNS